MSREQHCRLSREEIQISRWLPNRRPTLITGCQHFHGCPRIRYIRNWTPNAIRSFWRYVDDIFVVTPSGIHRHLSSYHKCIKFTMEFGGNTINFLDLTSKLEDYQNVLHQHFNAYRKLTFSGKSISNSSLHPPYHKMSLLTSASAGYSN